VRENPVISIENISKVYKLYHTPQDRLKEALHPFRRQYHKDFFALKDINFALYKGDALGIVGGNGSGKSTLLKIISGVLTPTSGKLEVNGKISALIELGTGFNPEFTGLENVYFKSSLLGFNRTEVNKVIDDIINFADIGEYINQPVKTYSSGMFVRLAFAVAINLKPDILILDEVMSVGDIRFAQKAMRRMEQLLENSKALIYVSHDTQSVINYCNKAIWLKNGTIEAIGEPKEIVEKYLIYSLDSEHYEKSITKDIENNKIKTNVNEFQGIEFTKVISKDEIKKNKSEITEYALCHKTTNDKVVFAKPNDELSLYLKFSIFKKLSKPIIGFSLKNDKGNPLFAENTYDYDSETLPLESGEYVTKFDFNVPNFRSGRYLIDVAVVDGEITDYSQEHYIFDAIILDVFNNSKKQYGQLILDIEIETFKL
jgi:ABC-type polysaccharide/polyol phosphate transport system ATPase subunit